MKKFIAILLVIITLLSISFEYLEHTDDVNITEKLTELCRKHNIPLK